MQTVIGDYNISTSAAHTADPAMISILQHLGEGWHKDADIDNLETMLQLVDALHQFSLNHDIATERSSNNGRPSCTTHFDVIDRHGNIVVATQILLSVFESAVISLHTGILLNNDTLWFDPVPGRPSSIAADRHPQSNRCPVIAKWKNNKDESAIMGIGAAGGRKILPAVIQILLRVLDGQDMASAFQIPRVETSKPGVLTADFKLNPNVVRALASR